MDSWESSHHGAGAATWLLKGRNSLENLLFSILMAACVLGLILTCGFFFHIARKGGFEKAMAPSSEGRWPLSRYLFFGAVACFVLALMISFNFFY